MFNFEAVIKVFDLVCYSDRPASSLTAPDDNLLLGRRLNDHRPAVRCRSDRLGWAFREDLHVTTGGGVLWNES